MFYIFFPVDSFGKVYLVRPLDGLPTEVFAMKVIVIIVSDDKPCFVFVLFIHILMCLFPWHDVSIDVEEERCDST